ncbi:MAG TPA: hypothetical protein VK774_09415 [Solirubrobacteraceae bacterium]|nr:hypothetical protein [Solirubrobacteraceae bacterium]
MTRLLNAWGALGRDQRWAALASLGLFVSMLLPWYSKTVVESAKPGQAKLPTSQASLNAFQAFSFVEAAVLLVSVGVLAMLFARAERRDFNLPGGDGTIVMIAGAWVAILIFYRLFDKPGLQGNQRIVSTVGVQWGIFVALLIGLGLAYCGRRVRLDERGAPPLSRARRAGPSAPEPDEPIRPRGRAGPEDATVAIAAPPPSRRERPRYPPSPSRQLSFEEEPTREDQD